MFLRRLRISWLEREVQLSQTHNLEGELGSRRVMLSRLLSTQISCFVKVPLPSQDPLFHHLQRVKSSNLPRGK